VSAAFIQAQLGDRLGLIVSAALCGLGLYRGLGLSVCKLGLLWQTWYGWWTWYDWQTWCLVGLDRMADLAG